jgi:HNH endonuclease
MGKYKLTNDQVIAMRNAAADGMTIKAVAAMYGVNPNSVRRLLNGITYPEVGGPIHHVQARIEQDATWEEVKAYAKELLFADIDMTEPGCWYWSGSLTEGYGRVQISNETYRVHVLAYEVFVGPVPTGEVVDHQCHGADESCRGGSDDPHRSCIRPDHLVAKSARLNIQEGRVGQNNRDKIGCPHDHFFEGANLYSYTDRDGITGRYCRECRRLAELKYRAKRAA